MIVLDSSAVITWLLGLPAAPAVEERIGRVGETLHAPELMPIEVAQVVRRYESTRQIATQRASQAIDDLAALSVAYYSHTALLPAIWGLRMNLTAYDAAYVALAVALDASLVTLDSRIANAPGNPARVELLRTA